VLVHTYIYIPYIILWVTGIFSHLDIKVLHVFQSSPEIHYTVEPVLRGHLWEKEKLDL
jgi:hypothetical protein